MCKKNLFSKWCGTNHCCAEDDAAYGKKKFKSEYMRGT
jgi:hypothetical protein